MKCHIHQFHYKPSHTHTHLFQLSAQSSMPRATIFEYRCDILKGLKVDNCSIIWRPTLLRGPFAWCIGINMVHISHVSSKPVHTVKCSQTKFTDHRPRFLTHPAMTLQWLSHLVTTVTPVTFKRQIWGRPGLRWWRTFSTGNSMKVQIMLPPPWPLSWGSPDWRLV